MFMGSVLSLATNALLVCICPKISSSYRRRQSVRGRAVDAQLLLRIALTIINIKSALTEKPVPINSGAAFGMTSVCCRDRNCINRCSRKTARLLQLATDAGQCFLDRVPVSTLDSLFLIYGSSVARASHCTVSTVIRWHSRQSAPITCEHLLISTLRWPYVRRVLRSEHVTSNQCPGPNMVL
ncbi:hypothetical protein HYPSUDRAFT_803108 [Hypholoma sublateritium FD-334 SS-4]|uniref:Secreted protein n=1 Tax=Hypholoma sublateritium (strain FD-334 SS-4) TaxID=945553 RepID=A0A0D2PB86_HYPSF|nr:hypothetical protein HYPSUDRAFT_803108 [Hypholoma sublateritium FD-334 SS-4]